MPVLEAPTDAEAALYAILTDPSGLDLAEFCWHEPSTPDGCFRAWPYQWSWWRNQHPQQIDQCARSVGKSLSIQVRGFAFPFVHPGQEMVITAPELVHLEPITGLIEERFYATRLGRELMQKGRSAVTHRPFMMNFANGARIIGRIPQKDGKGVKGIHPLWLELDEAQDYPKAGWTELVETLKAGFDGAVWRAHGVTRGVQDKFYEFTQETPDNPWHVHRYCLPGETMVYGANGPVPIAEIEPGTDVWAINEAGELVRDRVTERIDNGIKATWRVRAKGGYGLVSTPNHPYLVLSREGSRKTRRSLRFEWVEAQDLRAGDVIVCARELPGTTLSDGPTPDEVERTLEDSSPARTLPAWVWGATRATQLAFLHGYLMGDGSLSRQRRGQNAWQIGTSSNRMARELRALCHYLGLRATCIERNEHVVNGISKGPQWRFYVYADAGWFRQVPASYSVHELPLGKNFVARTVTLSEPTGVYEHTYDITVGENHNFVAEGVVTHNTAMHRPNWTDEERQRKIKQYGTREDPDYRRNVLGLHGDATNPLFVLHRLMRCVDSDESSEYNTDDYFRFEIKDTELESLGGEITGLLDFPYSHQRYETVWCGMDVGFTADPSEILIFAEYHPSATEKKADKAAGRVSPDDGLSRVKAIGRISLRRISHPDQVKVILHVMDFYRPKGFAMDKTGNGLPLFQDVQDKYKAALLGEADDLEDARRRAETIKGYNFSEKVIVDLDETQDKPAGPKVDNEDVASEVGIARNVLEYSTDKLREMVDTGRLLLPWDRELVTEFSGQTFSYSKASMDAYGRRRRIFSEGRFHALDAARMAVMGLVQAPIELFVGTKRQQEPVLDSFV